MYKWKLEIHLRRFVQEGATMPSRSELAISLTADQLAKFDMISLKCMPSWVVATEDARRKGVLRVELIEIKTYLADRRAIIPRPLETISSGA